MSQCCKIGIIVFCGLPASGKTVLCGKLQANLKQFSFIHVCYDDMLPWITDIDNLITWKNARSNVVTMVKHYMQCISLNCITDFETTVLKSEGCQHVKSKVSMAMQSTKPIIFFIDDNMQYRGMRYEYYQLSKAMSCGFSILFMNCPLTTCEERNKKRRPDKQVEFKSLLKIDTQMEIPGTSAVGWESRVLNINTSEHETVPENILTFLQDTLDNPVLEKIHVVDVHLSDACRETNRNNIHHQADIIMRRQCKQWIQSSEFMSDLSINSKSKKISKMKKQILTEIKSGLYDLDLYLHSDGTIDLEALGKKLHSLLLAYIVPSKHTNRT